MLQSALDPSVQQVSGLDGRRSEVRDPLLEHGRPQSQLLQRELGRAGLEPSRLRGVRGHGPRQPGHRSAEHRLTLIGREPSQPTGQSREPLPSASADREQLVVVAEQIAQRGADELHRHVAVGGLEVIDLVDHDQQTRDSTSHLDQELALALRQWLPRIEHADRRIDPGEEIAGHGRVVTVNRPDPGGVDQIESRGQQLVVELNARQLHAQVVARVPSFGHIV